MTYTWFKDISDEELAEARAAIERGEGIFQRLAANDPLAKAEVTLAAALYRSKLN